MQAAGGEDVLLGVGHLVGLAGDELDAAGGAAGVAAAGVELIDLGLVLQRQDQPLAVRHLERADAFHGQLRHRRLLPSGRSSVSLTREASRSNGADGTDHYQNLVRRKRSSFSPRTRPEAGCYNSPGRDPSCRA